MEYLVIFSGFPAAQPHVNFRRMALMITTALRRAMAPTSARMLSTGIPDIREQVVGREGEEIADADQNTVTFNRDPLATTETDGNSKENPILVPSAENERAVGISHNDSSYLMWFNLQKGNVHYVPDVEKYFKLYNPAEQN